MPETPGQALAKIEIPVQKSDLVWPGTSGCLPHKVDLPLKTGALPPMITYR